MNATQRTGVPPAGVIFDIGRVIVRVNLARALAPIAASHGGAGSAAALSPGQVWETIRSGPQWQLWQEGRLTPREWHQHLTRSLDLSLGFNEFCAAWNRALEPEPILSDSLFSQLASRCRLALLSNTDPLHVEHIEHHFSFCRYFPVRIYSCAVGLSKPSPAIYQAALAALGMDANRAVYIDDVEEFAEAARELGLDAIRFEGAEQLTVALSQRSLICD